MTDEVLTAWQGAGSELVMLPSGMEVRLQPVPLAELIRSGFLSGQLLAAAQRLGGEHAPETELTEEEIASHDELRRHMISRWVVAIRWVCACPECSRRRPAILDEQSYHVDPETLAADPPVIPRVDLTALEDMVSYIRSARQVDALGRVAHGQMDADEAARIIDEERVNTVAGWARFRHGASSLEALAGQPGTRGQADGRADAGPSDSTPAGRGARARVAPAKAGRRRGG